jgi:hypothetical protein
VTRAFLLAAIVLLVAAGCGGGSKSTKGRFQYPAQVTENYMRSCVKSKVTKAYCACTLDKLSDNVSTADFARIGLSGGRIPPRIRRLIQQAAVACADKL